MPWGLAAISVLPAVAFVGFAFLLSTFSPDADSPFGSHADYFILSGTIVALFVALAAPELLIPDRREGVLSIYSSRPMLPDDYVGSRFAALLTVVAGFMLIPQVAMYIGFAALDADGFFNALWSNTDDLPKILASTAAFAVGYGPLALLVAALTNRKSAATGLYLGTLLIGSVLAGIFIETLLSGRRYAAFLAVAEHPADVSNWIWGHPRDSTMQAAGFDPWVSLAVMLVVALVSTGIVIWRYRRLM